MSTAVEILHEVKSPVGAFKTITVDEAAFVNGNAYTHADYTLGVADSEVINYIFDPRNCTCTNIVAENPIFNATAGPITIEYYIGTTVSALGSELVAFNRRPTMSPPHAKLYVAPTITGDGVRIAGQLVPATEAVQGDTGSTTTSGLPFEVDKTQLMLIRVTNTNGAGVAIGRTFNWVEA